LIKSRINMSFLLIFKIIRDFKEEIKQYKTLC
jgi:hypothetical protein